jgi:hypothetical protein
MRSRRHLRLALVLAIITFALACRTAETIAQLRPPPTNTRIRTRTPTRRPTNIAAQQGDVTPTSIVAVTDEPPPTDEPLPDPTEETGTEPTRPRVQPQATPRPPNTPIPEPTTPQYAYRIKESRCGPNVRTYIEGTVFEGSVAKDGLIVRISQGPDGQPDPNEDYRTGTDPKRKGYYYHNINAGAPHGGTWYLWVMDPATMKRISDIAIVKTDAERVEDSGNSAGSCQSATVNFTTQPPPPTVRPTNTPPPNQPNPTATQDPGNDS